MSSQHLNIVRFAGLVVGVPVALPHNLNIDGRALTPDVVLPTLGGFTVVADATNVTVTRTADAPGGVVDVLVWYWHTLLRAFGAHSPSPGVQPDGSLAPQPLVLQPGTVSGVSVAGRYALPEKWGRDNLVSALTGVALDARVSTLFPTIKMIRPGSLLGLSTRLTEAITNGTLDVTVQINGANTALSLSHDSGTNPSGGQATQAAGVSPFVAGDLVGIVITTNTFGPAFAPTTTDLECWIDVDTD